MFFLYLLVIVIIVFGVTIFLEKIFHSHSSLKILVEYAVRDLSIFLKGICKFVKECASDNIIEKRHIWDFSMVSDLRSVVVPHVEEGFLNNIEICCLMVENVPSICIAFQPKQSWDEEMLSYVGSLLQKKFTKNCNSRNIYFKNFITCYQTDFVYFYIHYIEFPFDMMPFNQLFLFSTKRQKNEIDGFGIVYDAELEQAIEKLEKEEKENEKI